MGVRGLWSRRDGEGRGSAIADDPRHLGTRSGLRSADVARAVGLVRHGAEPDEPELVAVVVEAPDGGL